LIDRTDRHLGPARDLAHGEILGAGFDDHLERHVEDRLDPALAALLLGSAPYLGVAHDHRSLLNRFVRLPKPTMARPEAPQKK